METKISLIGAGSASFGLKTIFDIAQAEDLNGSTLVLIDINKKKLDIMKKVAEKLDERFNANLKIEASTNAKEVLSGSQFVVISAEKERMKRWYIDFRIPSKYGFKHVIGECGGPGGLAHTLRVIPLILEICRDIEDYCANALVLNYTNPEGRICLGISRYTKLKAVGLCPGIYETIEKISPLMGVDPDKVEAIAAGLNHFTWILDLRLKDGRDLYPLLREKLSENPEFEPLCQELFHTFGLFPSPGDNHVGEYVPYAWEKTPVEVRGLNWLRSIDKGGKRFERVSSIASGKMPEEEFKELSDQYLLRTRSMAVKIMVSVTENKRYMEYAVNLPNKGYITNLPENVIVEVPGIVDASGVRGVGIGALPKGIAALCQLQATIQELSVEAAAEGSYHKALQALLVDPVINHLDNAKVMLRELLDAHAPLLPQFAIQEEQ